MAATAVLPVEEYLATRFDGPTPEYLDGHLVERNVPTFSHSEVQGTVSAFFAGMRPPWFPAVEIHVRVTPSRYRVLDVGVFYGQRPTEDYPSMPPLIDIEILSPYDRLGAIVDRFEELRAWGVKYLWLIDPVHRTLYTLGRHGVNEVEVLAVPEFGLRLSPDDIFA